MASRVSDSSAVLDDASPRRHGVGRRLRESYWSALAISVAIHLAAFAVLMRIVWQDLPAPARWIVAEAWLGPAGGGSGGGDGLPRAEKPASPPGGEAKPAADAAPPVAARMPSVPDPELARLVETIAADTSNTVPAAGLTGAAGIGLSLGAGGPGAGTGGGTGGGAGGFAGVTAGGPDSGFFGQRGNAYKVVYVIDTSGSLGWIFEPVQQALIDSIDRLLPSQSFHVIFAGARPVELPERRLVPAITHYTEPAKAFIRQLVPELRCDPVAAMERAFACQPELIYFLSDGDFGPIGADLLARLREWNRDRRVHITTIGFGVKLKSSSLGGQPIGEPILRQIAQEHGGNFRWVSPDDTPEATP